MAKAVTLDSIQQSINDMAVSIKDLAQFTSDGFEKVDTRLAEHTAILVEHSAILADHSIILRDHTSRFIQIQSSLDDISDTQEMHSNDIKEIYSIISKYNKNQKLSLADKKDAEIRLNRVVAWAKEASEVIGVPLKI